MFGLGRKRTVPGTGQRFPAVVFGPDAWSVQAASLGFTSNTSSPASSGVHETGRTGPRIAAGLPGFGEARMTGPIAYELGAYQAIGAPSAPVSNPIGRKLGIGAGVSGQPGLPSTGDSAGFGVAGAPLGWGG